jgi:hypothetical protein
MPNDKTTPLNRRAFFGVAATGAAATTLLKGSATPVLAQSGDERTRARYRVTEHIETFYRTNRYTRPQE